MAITTVQIDGKITKPGTTDGVKARVTFTPATRNAAVTFEGEGHTWGPVVAETAADGTFSVDIPVHPTLGDELLWIVEAKALTSDPPLDRWEIVTSPITVAGDLDGLTDTDLLGVTPTLVADIIDARDRAETAATAADADADRAETARDDAVDISNISTSDEVVEGLIEGVGGAGPLTRAALTETIDTSVNGTHRVPLFVFVGESNSGGQALNSNLTAPELDPRPAVQILNNDTLLFEALDIGTNNLIGHNEFNATMKATFHGWEAGLADAAEADEFAAQVYLVKAGQGGSRFDQWEPADTYPGTLQTRLQAAVDLIRGMGKTPDVYVCASIGINDASAGMSAATYKTGLTTWLDTIRDRIQTVVGYRAPVMLTELPYSSSAGTAGFNPKIVEVCDADPLAWLIRTSQAQTKDVAHWSAGGMKRIAAAMVDRALRTIGQNVNYRRTLADADALYGTTVEGFVPIAWTSASAGTNPQPDGAISSGNQSSVGALGGAIDVTQPFEIEIYYPAGSTQGAIVLLDTDNAATFTFAGSSFVTGIYHDGNWYYGVGSSPSPINTGNGASPFPAYARMTKSGDDVLYSESHDGGVTFEPIVTHVGVLSGETTLYLKVLFAQAKNPGTIRVAKRAELQ